MRQHGAAVRQRPTGRLSREHGIDRVLGRKPRGRVFHPDERDETGRASRRMADDAGVWQEIGAAVDATAGVSP
jgi:hypothetical protein